MKDTRNILLLVVSLCLVGTWAYHIYDKNNYAQEPVVVVKKDTVAEQKAVNDSLRTSYSKTLAQLDTTARSKDSMNITGYAVKTSEIDNLRNEIYAILNLNAITKEDLRRAEVKLKLLQQKIGTSDNGNTEISKQTKTSEVKNPVVVSSDSKVKPETKTVVQNKQEAEPVLLNTVNISFRAFQAAAKDQPTTKADDAGYFAVSCLLQNVMASFTDTDVYLVLTDPQGNVIQDDQWQAGMFSTRSNTRIPYSRKSSFSYAKGDTKRITVNIKPSEILQGSYSLQIYHNGTRIGKSDLRLN